MKLNFSSQNFKGYAPTPLKALHIEEYTSSPIKEELSQIAKEEGFKIRTGLDYNKWAQDFKMIIEKENTPFIVANNRVSLDYLNEMQERFGISSKTNDFIVTGGNSFIGKYPNGEKWMLIGQDELDTKSLSYISSEYNIKEENIFPIPQQNFHIDMFIRPLEYPYVLVDDSSLVSKKIDKMDRVGHIYDYINLKQDFRQYSESLKKHYAASSETIKALKKAGFKPILIAGVYGSGINFLNAIVNKHPDGTISYITNSTLCENEYISKIQEEFEKDLRKSVENIARVYFITGQKDCMTTYSNYMMDELAIRKGGIHCMTMEEPNFEIWG